MSREEVLRVEGVERVYGQGRTAVHALRGISFHMVRGELVSLIGPSGCGKSTLLNLIGCLDRPTQGRVFIDGHDMAAQPDDRLATFRNRRIGFIFQIHNLLPRMTAQLNVELPLLYAGKQRAERHRIAAEQLARVGLAERAHHLPAQLSGGERQRVAIARALVMNPSLLLADEPTGSLDSQSGSQILGLIESLHQAGSTILLVTHDPDTSGRAERILTMRDGVIVSDRAPRSKSNVRLEESQ